MRRIKGALILCIISTALNSCLVTTSPRYHYFISRDTTEINGIKVFIFSTPKYKNYVVENTDGNDKVLIKSPVFENPQEFYLMQDQNFFGQRAKQFKLALKDGKYYSTEAYKHITLKIINDQTHKKVLIFENK